MALGMLVTTSREGVLDDHDLKDVVPYPPSVPPGPRTGASLVAFVILGASPLPWGPGRSTGRRRSVSREPRPHRARNHTCRRGASGEGSSVCVTQSSAGCGAGAWPRRGTPLPGAWRRHRRARSPSWPSIPRARRGASTRTSMTTPNRRSATPSKPGHPMPRVYAERRPAGSRGAASGPVAGRMSGPPRCTPSRRSEWVMSASARPGSGTCRRRHPARWCRPPKVRRRTPGTCATGAPLSVTVLGAQARQRDRGGGSWEERSGRGSWPARPSRPVATPPPPCRAAWATCLRPTPGPTGGGDTSNVA